MKSKLLAVRRLIWTTEFLLLTDAGCLSRILEKSNHPVLELVLAELKKGDQKNA